MSKEEMLRKLKGIHLLYSMPQLAQNMMPEHFAIVEYEKLAYEQQAIIDQLTNIIKKHGLEDKPDYYVDGLIGSIKERDEEISRLRKGIYKILKLNDYMIHCESKEVIYKFLMKQWRTIYETLGIPEPGLARCSKNNLQNGSDDK